MRGALLGGKRFHRESRLLVRPDLKWHGPPTFCGYGGNSSKWEGRGNTGGAGKEMGFITTYVLGK